MSTRSKSKCIISLILTTVMLFSYAQLTVIAMGNGAATVYIDNLNANERSVVNAPTGDWREVYANTLITLSEDVDANLNIDFWDALLLVDLNFDGTPELALKSVYPKWGAYLWLCTIKDGTVELIFEGYDNITLCENNGVYSWVINGIYNYVDFDGSADPGYENEETVYIANGTTVLDREFKNSTLVARLTDGYNKANKRRFYKYNGDDVSEAEYANQKLAVHNMLLNDYKRSAEQPAALIRDGGEYIPIKRILDFLNEYTLVPSINSLDSADSWARNGIVNAVEKGFVPMDLQNNYTEAITRQDFCRLAVKWLEYIIGKDIDAILIEQGAYRRQVAFSDTDDPDILAAFTLGITNGRIAPTETESGLFVPNGEFTRQEAATMIMRTCKAAGMDVSEPPISDFLDLDKADDWAQAGINFVRANGIMGGISVDPDRPEFGPKKIYTRQESIITFNNIK